MRSVQLGALAWLLAAQFFATQVAVASAWHVPFSLTTHAISDLGNTRCGPYPNRSSPIICSPWHAAMNASFIVIGITMGIGAVLTRRVFRPGWAGNIAVPLFVAAGAGVVMVGIYPENEQFTRHALGAGVNFLAGNVALVLFGIARPSTRAQASFRWFSIIAGATGLVATVLFVVRQDLGLGLGAMERVAVYPMAIWQMVAGLFLLSRIRHLGGTGGTPAGAGVASGGTVDGGRRGATSRS